MSSDSPPPPSPSPSHGHVRIAYDDPVTFQQHAGAFPADRAAAGQRLWYVAAARPFTAVGGYDRAELGEDTVARPRSLRPEADTGVPVRPPSDCAGGCGSALTGELDLSTEGLPAAASAMADPPATDSERVVQAARLDVIDHRSLRRPHDCGCRRGVTVVPRAAAPAVGRLARLLDPPRIGVEAA